MSLKKIATFQVAAALLVAGLTCPPGGLTAAHAQRGGSSSGAPRSNSDVTSAIPIPQIPPGINVFTASPTVVGLPVPPITGVLTSNPTSPTFVSDVVEFNTAMEKLMWCAGCADVNWRSYNDALTAVRKLRLSLAEESLNQRKVLTSNPTPAQLVTALKVIEVMERTTTSLEAATRALVFLGNSYDAGR